MRLSSSQPDLRGSSGEIRFSIDHRASQLTQSERKLNVAASSSRHVVASSDRIGTARHSNNASDVTSDSSVVNHHEQQHAAHHADDNMDAQSNESGFVDRDECVPHSTSSSPVSATSSVLS
jgi:hypothetical protein